MFIEGKTTVHVPLYSVHMPEGIGKEIESVLQSGKIASGEYVALFEARLQELVGNPYLLTVGEMSTGITLSLYLAGVRPGDEVVASPMACVATTAPVRNLFADLKWCDCDPNTGAMDPDSLRRVITPKTKAVLVFHWAGNPVDLAEIYEVASSHGLPVIEDASEALGAAYRGNLLGNTGADFTVFSFYPNRHLSTIEGAAISFKDPNVYERCRWLRRYGINTSTFRLPSGEIDPNSDIVEAGWNSSMNQVTSLIGVSQMRTFAGRLQIHRENGRFYDDALKDSRKVGLLRRPADSESSFWVYTLLTQNPQQLSDYLRKRAIQSSAVHLRNDVYSCFGPSSIELPGVDEFSERALSIPCGWWVSKDTRERIASVIREFDESHG